METQTGIKVVGGSQQESRYAPESVFVEFEGLEEVRLYHKGREIGHFRGRAVGESGQVIDDFIVALAEQSLS